MSSVDTTERAIRLLSLLSSRRGWRGPELADRLGVTERTLRRDIERLRLLGYRIDGTRGTAGGYELAAGTDAPPLFLDEDEAMAVVAALLLAVGNRSTGMAEASARALGKLHHVLPAKVFRRVAAFSGAARTVPGAGGPPVAPDVVAALAGAVRDRRQVRFAYRTRDGRSGHRRTEPHSLVTPGRVWYLVAFDLDRDDWRVFRVDRIEDLDVTGHGAAPRELPGGDPTAFLGRAIARTPLAHQARVDVPMAADRLRAALPDLLPDRVTADGRHRCRVDLGADTVDDLVVEIVRVLLAAPDATVGTTAPVRRRVDTLAAALAAGRGRRPAGDQ